jgi:hypothetical protein
MRIQRQKTGSSMSAQTIVEETSRFEQLLADLKIPIGVLTGAQHLADAVAQAGNAGFSSTWPHWAFELAKAALLSQQCSVAEALEAVTRSHHTARAPALVGLSDQRKEAALCIFIASGMSRSSTTLPQFLDSRVLRRSFYRLTLLCFMPSSLWSSTPVSAPLTRISCPPWQRCSIQPTCSGYGSRIPDRDHTGGLWPLLEAAPTARLITTFLGMGIMSTEWTVPLNRVFLLNPGQAVDVGDRRLQCFRPPLFDSPSTAGFLDDRTGVLFSSDCFGAPMPSEDLAASDDVRAVGDQVRDFQLLWASIDSPWVHQVDPARFRATVDPVRASGASRSSAATCRLCSSRTTGSSKPCCLRRRQTRSSAPTRRHSRPCSPLSRLPSCEMRQKLDSTHPLLPTEDMWEWLFLASCA